MKKIKFGVFLPFYSFQAGANADSSRFDILRKVVLECERLGYDSFWLDDHLMWGEMPILECWTMLSALLANTKRIRGGTMVTSAGFRNPAVLAKMAATVDVMSNGRLEFGIGAGVQKQEYDAYGLRFEEANVRIERLAEAVEIIKKLWTEAKATFTGKHYNILEAVCEPKPLQKSHPPITIGGCGEKLTLKVTAKHADRCDFGYLSSIELYKQKLHVLEKHCKTIGRNFDEIEKSCWPSGQILLWSDLRELAEKVKRFKPKNVSQSASEKCSFLGAPEDFVERIQSYVDLGVTYFMLFFGDLPETGSLHLFSEKIVKKMTSLSRDCSAIPEN